MRRLMLLLLILLPICCLAEDEEIYFEDVIVFNPQEAISVAPPVEVQTEAPETAQNEAREEFIDRIFDLGHELYVAANGKAQRAYKKGDNYLCKNFTTQAMIDKARTNGLICNLFWADTAKEAKAYMDIGIDCVLTNNFGVVKADLGL